MTALLTHHTFDGTIVACMIDALSALSKRSSPSHNISVSLDPMGEARREADDLARKLTAGDISKNEVDRVTNVDVLWHAIVAVLTSVSIFSFNDEDVAFEASKMPSHITRFLGAFSPTFEILVSNQMGDAVYFPRTLQVSLMNNRPTDDLLLLLREYRSMFSFSYMFNRRTAKYPTSIVHDIAPVLLSLQST